MCQTIYCAPRHKLRILIKTKDQTATSMTPRVIKRYENRKLYDTTARSYVSLNDIADLVRNGETIQVIDNATGDDLTASTLTQIILEAGKKGNHLIPTDLLHDLVRRSTHVLEDGVAQLRKNVDSLVQTSFHRLEQWLPVQRENAEIQALKQQLSQLENMVSQLLADKNQPSSLSETALKNDNGIQQS